MRGLLFVTSLSLLSACATPHWDAPHGYTVKDARADEYQCELETRAAMASFSHYLEREIVLGHKAFDEQFYGRCLIGKGWVPGEPVAGRTFPQPVTFQRSPQGAKGVTAVTNTVTGQVSVPVTNGCSKDTDCKGDRICENAMCADPNSIGTSPR